MIRQFFYFELYFVTITLVQRSPDKKMKPMHCSLAILIE